MQERKSFTKILQPIDLPDLIEIQKASYDWFFEKGLKELFQEISPIKDYTGRDLELHFLKYYLDDPKFDEGFCKEKNITYEAPLRINIRLVSKKSGIKREQEVYLGDVPVMTDRGTFVINGIERVVVSQLIRSPGAFFSSEYIDGRKYYGAKIIPNRGAWLEFETDTNNVLWVKIDRKRRVAVTSLLRAFGYGSDDQILELFKDIDTHPDNKYIKNTLEKDLAKNEDEGLIEIYRRIRPGDLATAENAKGLIHSMFFRFDRYDLGSVGRYKFNKRFSLEVPNKIDNRILRIDDLVLVIKEIIKLNNTQKEADDIDHLGNRRVRSVGELVQNKFRVGLARMERIVKDRMSTLDFDSMTPSKLVNARPLIGVIKEFFMSSQLSQFMDQTSPLSELEHKRRLSAMGPGGLTRERAGFDVRDVHRTHYGRICPIATPEGPNIGLVGHLATFAKINEHGFLETPFRKISRKAKKDFKVKDEKNDKEISIKKGEKIKEDAYKLMDDDLKKQTIDPIVTEDIIYLDAFTEEKYITTPATTKLDDNGRFVKERVEVRKYGEPGMEDAFNVDYMDVSPKQIVSVATSLIPFLEHDDAVRALMGTNMQRQAVPCIIPDSPIVGTGIEKRAAQDSGYVIVAPKPGKITYVDSNKIELLTNDNEAIEYKLNKFIRSNQSTCINQRPTIEKGQKVKKGDVLADGPATDKGELALGQNVLVAYMSWEGYNYEDAVIISDRLVQSDLYTSIHIEEYSIDIRETKLGPEVITSDIPNISEEKLKDLDAEGIVRIGAKVSSGDILVGKITPKGETELSAEEKLIRAIFGEKARDVRDSSLYLEHGEQGRVIDIKMFSREAGDKLAAGVIKTVQVSVAQLRKIQVGDKMAGRHGNKGVISTVVPVENMPYLEDGTPIDIVLSPLGVVSRMNLGQILETHLGLAAHKLSYKVMVPTLNGPTQQQISDELKKAGYSKDGKMIVFDGRSGEPFNQMVTVGYNYMLKLVHMVEDKIHQRSIGPYSLITQQPLGGKAQFGGQRFGEMEVWALEGFGAAHSLQEMLTIKSDDVPGRSKAYEAIIKGEAISKLNVPEAFNVMVRELKGLGLDVNLVRTKEMSDVKSKTTVKKAEKK